MFTPHNSLTSLNANELIKYFNQLFSKVSMKHGEYNTFENFLDCCINGLSFNYDKEIMNRIVNDYTQDERYIFGEMLQIWVRCMDLKVQDDNSFYDFFGNIYEQNSMTKAKGFAQYFTPEPVCKLLAQLTVQPNNEGEKINEPACGSGRNNLAAHSINHKMFHVANDLDITCAKMTALNFTIHGIKGVVTCDDGLFPKSKFRGAFIINYRTAPLIEYCNDVNVIYSFLDTIVGGERIVNLENNTTPVIKTEETNTVQNVQLNLFSF